jgi:hypothetical protein
MKPRARRVTIAAAVLGVGVVAVLAVAHWGTVRDHVEAWHFQLTLRTAQINPGEQLHEFEWWRHNPVQATQGSLLRRLANDSGMPVVMLADFPWRAALVQLEWQSGSEVFSAADSLQCLRAIGWRIVATEFPRRTYVVLSTEDPLQWILRSDSQW